MLENIAYADEAGAIVRLPNLQVPSEPAFVSAQAWWQGGYGLRWTHEDHQVMLFPGVPISAFPTPNGDGVIVLDPPGMSIPNNAAIYDADGSLRFQLRAPKPLSRHLPGYVHTAEEVAKLPPQGFWQVGWGCGDGITNINRPWMWANIGLWYDVYERRYFDPTTGEFDLQHYHVSRR